MLGLHSNLDLSRRDFAIDFTFIDGCAFGPAFVIEQEFCMVDAHEVEDCRVNIVHVHTIFNGMQPDFVG